MTLWKLTIVSIERRQSLFIETGKPVYVYARHAGFVRELPKDSETVKGTLVLVVGSEKFEVGH